MRQYFKNQLETTPRATKEVIDALTKKHFHSGREIKEGDVVLFAWMEENLNLEEDTVNMRLLSLHEDELDQYELVEETNSMVPKIQPIRN